MVQTAEILHEERADTRLRLARLAEIGRHIFEQTALVQEREFRQDDVSRVGEFFEKYKQDPHPQLLPSYWEHIDLAGRFARIFGKRLQSKGLQVNPHELEACSMIHDIGRLISPHRYFRTNLVGESLLLRLGVREDVRRKQVPEMQLFGRGGNITNINQLTLGQQVLLFADNMGRKTEDGNLIRFDQLGDLIEQQTRQYQGRVFASERFGIERQVATDKKIILIMNDIKQRLQDQYGIRIDEVREEVSRSKAPVV